jgi:hypothetical protein
MQTNLICHRFYRLNARVRRYNPKIMSAGQMKNTEIPNLAPIKNGWEHFKGIKLVYSILSTTFDV